MLKISWALYLKIFTDLADGSVIGRLTKLEDPSLQTAAEGDTSLPVAHSQVYKYI